MEIYLLMLQYHIQGKFSDNILLLQFFIKKIYIKLDFLIFVFI